MIDTQLVTIGDLEAAARVLAPVAVRTPLLPADPISEKVGVPVYIKPEMLQRGGAFKFRGAYNFLSSMDPHERARGVVAPSSGNHAQAVALAAKLFGIPATVVMPTTVTAAKRNGAERLGARIVLAGTTTADRLARAEELMRDEGLTLVPPYDDQRIIAGQGTVGLEIAADLPNVETVLVPVGGGGFSAGVASAIKMRLPNARVIGVEPTGAPKLSRARAAGRPVKLESSGGLADGLLAVEIGSVTFAHHQRYIDDVVLVDDAALKRAMRLLLDRLKLVVEPSGAITVAALLEGKVKVSGPTVAILSGGNIEWEGLRGLLGDDTPPRGGRVIVAEGHPVVAGALSWLLREQGYSVSAVTDRRELFDSISHQTPDVIVLDGDVVENDSRLLEELRADARWHDVRVIVTAPFASLDDGSNNLPWGADDCVSKPFRVPEILGRVRTQLRASGQLRVARSLLADTTAELERARGNAANNRRLVDILHEVTGELSATEIYRLLVRRVSRTLEISHCSVILARSGDSVGTIAAAAEDPNIQDVEINLDGYPEITTALDSERPVFIEDAATHPLFIETRQTWESQGRSVDIRSVATIPFSIDRWRSGVLFLRTALADRPLTADDVEFADIVIRAAVAAIRRAQALETTRADNIRLEALATTDPLTRVLNRRALLDRLTAEVDRARRFNSSLSLLLLDVDHFKQINDTAGHLAGDAVLRQLGAVLEDAIRKVDIVARYGGEEFVAILPETAAEGGIIFAERLRERIAAQAFDVGIGRPVRLTVSIGIATFPSPRIATTEDFFARADEALYRAKSGGRNQVRT